MNRRALLKAAGLGAAALVLGGHTPYRQWVVYRKKHLLIGCHRQDPRTYELAQDAVAVLDEHLPAASARVARAPHAGRLASLLGTEQLDVAVLAADQAAAMRVGSGAFEPYGPISLNLLSPLRDRLLIARSDFPARHAWLVAEALMETTRAGDASIPLHPGARAFLRGDPVPAG